MVTRSVTGKLFASSVEIGVQARRAVLSDDSNVRTRQFLLPLATAVICLGQADWKAVSALPGIDWQGLTGAKKDGALKLMQAEDCTCGCGLKIAECRIKDHTCGVSRKLANTVVRN